MNTQLSRILFFFVAAFVLIEAGFIKSGFIAGIAAFLLLILDND